MPPLTIKIMARIYQTKIKIVDNQTEKEGWCKMAIDLDEVEAVRPWINDDNKYEHCYIYTRSGLEAIIYDDYEEFLEIWVK
jgi:hypothetical protein